MYALGCVDGYRRPLRDEVFVLDIVPLLSGPVTISSDQALAAFDPNAGLRRGPVKTWQTGHGNITCASAYDAAGGIVCTAGQDGSVSVWDTRLEGAQAQVAKMTDNDSPILSLACSGSGYSVVAGTELHNHQASILIWDVRSTPKPRHKYQEVHSDDVTELNFHPNDPAMLLTGSTDGLVNVCDTRITDEDEVVVQAFNHDASIHHAAFLNDTEVYAVSHDEKLALYDVAEGCDGGAATTSFGDVREQLGCQYVANVFTKAHGAGAVIGAGTHDKEMFELVHLTKGSAGWVLDRENSVGLPGAHSSEIVRSFCFYDEAGIVFSAGEDGYIKAWRSEGA